MSEKTSVTVENGKYTWEVQDGKVTCLMGGQPWIDNGDKFIPGYGNKAIVGLISELHAARVFIEKIRNEGMQDFKRGFYEGSKGVLNAVKQSVKVMEDMFDSKRAKEGL